MKKEGSPWLDLQNFEMSDLPEDMIYFHLNGVRKVTKINYGDKFIDDCAKCIAEMILKNPKMIKE